MPQEAKKDTIELPEDEDVLQALINYFYSFTWDDSKMGDLSTIEFAVLVYQAADKVRPSPHPSHPRLHSSS